MSCTTNKTNLVVKISQKRVADKKRLQRASNIAIHRHQSGIKHANCGLILQRQNLAQKIVIQTHTRNFPTFPLLRSSKLTSITDSVVQKSRMMRRQRLKMSLEEASLAQRARYCSTRSRNIRFSGQYKLIMCLQGETKGLKKKNK